MAEAAGGLYSLVLDKYRIDELYGAVIIQPLIWLSTYGLLEGHRRELIDGAVDGALPERRKLPTPCAECSPATFAPMPAGLPSGGCGHCLHGLEGLR